MALSFPLSLAHFFDLLPASACRFAPSDAIEMDETVSGEILTADLGTALWAGQIDMELLLNEEAASIGPLINMLRRPGTSFFVSDHRRPWPRLDPEGLILGTTRPVIAAATARALSLGGLPPGYVLSRGDLLAFPYGSVPTRYALHELAEDATATGSGTIAMTDVSPPVRAPAAAVGATVQLIWPACKAVLIPAPELGETSETVTTGMSFRWTQTLR